MIIYAMGDLHLDGGDDKPMDVFGPQWKDHARRMEESWRETVRGEDIVLIPGDISWAMQLPAARGDLDWIARLPGRKVLLRGNHDYWWSAIGRVRDALSEGMYALQNDALLLDGVLFAGSRGWLLPGESAKDEDKRIYDREVLRLEMSLKDARRLSEDAPLIALCHYPPIFPDGRETECSRLLTEYRALICVYGHLHGAGIASAFRGEAGGVQYHLVSSDSLGFRPLPIFAL